MNIRSLSVFYEQEGKKKRDVRILFDSGATGSFMSEEHARKLRVKNTSAAVWKTGNSNIKTDKKVKTHFILPELYPERIIEHTFHLLPTMTGYDMIISTDLVSELGLKTKFPRCVCRMGRCIYAI